MSAETGGMVTLELGPELTIYQVAELRQAWLAAYGEGLEAVDLSRVAEVDASGLQLLVALHRMALRDGRTLRFGRPSAVLAEALALVGAGSLTGAAAAAGGDARA